MSVWSGPFGKGTDDTLARTGKEFWLLEPLQNGGVLGWKALIKEPSISKEAIETKDYVMEREGPFSVGSLPATTETMDQLFHQVRY